MINHRDDIPDNEIPDEIIINGVRLTVEQCASLQIGITLLLKYTAAMAVDITPLGVAVDEAYRLMAEVLELFKYDVPSLE